MSRYSVVVVAHDHPRQLLQTLLALRKHGQPSEVLVVDNASGSDLSGIIKVAQLPSRHRRLPDHRSLGAAFNVGLDMVESDLILLLHGDVLIETDPEAGVEFLDRQPDVGIVGGKLFQNTAPPRRVLHAGYNVGRGRVSPRSIGHLEWDRFHDSADVAAVSDACMMVRRTELRFDERYWFRLEDVDLCYQYQQRGYRVVVLPTLQAIHLESGGMSERREDLDWAARQIATRWLYHERWCSDLPLDQHPLQLAIHQ